MVFGRSLGWPSTVDLDDVCPRALFAVFRRLNSIQAYISAAGGVRQCFELPEFGVTKC